MASNYTFRGTADMSQHNAELKKSAAEVYKYQKQVQNAQKQLNDFGKSVNGSVGGLKNLSDAFASGNIGSFGMALQGLIPTMGAVTTSAASMGTALNVALGPVGLITGAIAAIGGVIGSSVKSVSEFETHLDGLQSLTGLSDEAMKGVADGAVNMSKNFRSSAGEIVESMKLIGSQAPELLKDSDALMQVTEAANVLSEAAQIQVVDAAKGITTVMNQMGVGGEEAASIINVLAAASQQGAGDVAYLNKAFEKAGTSAKSANMSYVELAALIETFAPKFSSADEAGSQLKSTLLALSVGTNDKFKPAVVGVSEALKNLSAAELTDSEMKDLVGESNITMLKTLIEGLSTFNKYSETLQGTNTAYEQMATNNDNLEGAFAKLKNSWDAFMLSLGQSGIIQGVIAAIQIIIKQIQDGINYISDIIKEFQGLDGTIDLLTILQGVLKALGVVWKAVVQIIQVGIALIIKYFNYVVDRIRNAWKSVKEILGNLGIFEPIKQGCLNVIKWFGELIGKLKKWWTDFKKWLGLNVAEVKIKDDKLKPIKKKGDGTDDDDDDDGKGNGGKGNGGTGVPRTTRTKVKIDYDKGSLDDLRKQLSDLQKKLSSKNLKPVDVKRIQDQIEALKEKITKKEIELGIKPKEGSLEWIDNSISELDNKIKKLNPTVDYVEIDKLIAKKEALQQLKKDTEAVLNGVEVTAKRFESKGVEGTQQYASDKVSYYKQQLSLSVKGTEDYDYLIEKLKEWTEKEHQIKVQTDLDLNINGDENSIKFIQGKISEIQSKLELTAYGSPEYNKLTSDLKEWTSKEQVIQAQIEFDNKSTKDKVDDVIGGFDGIDGVISSMESLVNAVNDGANAWEVFMGAIDVVSSSLEAFESVLQAVDTIQRVLGTTTQATAEISTAATATDTANTATEVANSAARTSAKTGEAVVDATASGAKLPFPANIAAIAAGVAAVIAAISMIGSFANGGIVDGKTTIGDYNLARVNGGEMILNGKQQKHLFNMIDNNRFGGSGAIVGGEVKIKGSDLYIALRNYGKGQSKLGKNIGIK